MHARTPRSKQLTFILSTLVLLVAGLPMAHAEEAGGGGHQGHGTHGGGRMMGMMAGESGEKCRAMRHGEGPCRGEHSEDQALYGEDWESGLSDEQKAQLDRLYVSMIRAKAPAKARVKAARIELAVMATTAEPDEALMEAKLDELLAGKRDMLRAEYRYRAAVRKVLTAEQQASYDLSVVQEAKGGKGKKGRH